MAWGRDGFGSDRFSAADLDSRNPQIGSFFCPLCEEAGRAGKTGCAVGSRLRAATNDQTRGFFGTCGIVPPELSNPRVPSSSLGGRIEKHWKTSAFLISGERQLRRSDTNPQKSSNLYRAKGALVTGLARCSARGASRHFHDPWRGLAAGRMRPPGPRGLQPSRQESPTASGPASAGHPSLDPPASPRVAVLLGQLLRDLAHHQPTPGSNGVP